MPNEGISMYFTIRDGASSVLKTIGDQTKVLDKETQALKQAYSALDEANKPLIDRQNELKTALGKSSATVNDARKAFRELRDESSELKMTEAIAEQDKLRQELKDVESQLKSNRSAFNEYRESIRKGMLETNNTNGGSGLMDVGAMLGSLEIGKHLSSMMESVSNALIGSAFGSEAGGIVSSGLSSAISGAATGSLFGPLGAAIGGALGGLSGVFSAGVETWSNRDDAFVAYYNGLYEDVSAATENTITSGSATAGSREQTQLAFEQRLGGKAAAEEYLVQVEKMAVETNYDYDEIVGYTKTLLNSYNPDEVFGVLQTLSDASGGLGLDSSDVNQLIQGLYMLRGSDAATDQYIKYFRTRGVDTTQALADYLGVDTNEVSGLVSSGQVSGLDAAEAMLTYIDHNYGGLSQAQSETYDAMVANLADITASLDAVAGNAYNAVRKEGILDQQKAFDGELGAAIEEINAVIGENRAYLENLSDQYYRDTLSAVLLGQDSDLFSASQQMTLDRMHEEYLEWAQKREDGDEDAGREMERLYEEAQGLATAYYESSDAMQRQQETELEQIEAIRENTAGLAAATNAYRLSAEQSKGIASVTYTDIYGKSRSSSDSLLGDFSRFDTDPTKPAYSGIFDVDPGSFAVGLDRVPYDDFPALLHAGERVLTASEARAQDVQVRGKAKSDIIVTGNNFVGTGEEMADQIAEILARKLEQADAVRIR